MYTPDDLYLLKRCGWVVRTDLAGNLLPSAYMPMDYDGCHAEGEENIRRVIESCKQQVERGDMKIFGAVGEWFDQSRDYFKLNEYRGIDIQSELYWLVRSQVRAAFDYP